MDRETDGRTGPSVLFVQTVLMNEEPHVSSRLFTSLHMSPVALRIFTCLHVSPHVFTSLDISSCLHMSSRLFTLLYVSSRVLKCLPLSFHLFTYVSHRFTCLHVSSRLFTCLPSLQVSFRRHVSSHVFLSLSTSSDLFLSLHMSPISSSLFSSLRVSSRPPHTVFFLSSLDASAVPS